MLPQRGHCAQPHRRPVSGKVGTVPPGERILRANVEPSWQGSEGEDSPTMPSETGGVGGRG